MTNNYEKKYLKYKEKYLELKNQLGSGTPRPEMSENEFEDLMLQAFEGETEAVLAAVNLDGSLATRTNKHFFHNTLLQTACLGGHVELARGLLAHGASVGTRDHFNSDATYYASENGNLALVTLMLDHGGDPNTRTNANITTLGAAARRGHLDVCLLLLSRGADLMAVMYGRNTVLGQYGAYADPRLSLEIKDEHREALLAAWRAGPHPSQRWARRLPMMLFVTGCRFRPLVGRQGWVPPERLTFEQRERARRRSLVFSSDVLLRLIVSFL